MLSKVIWMHIEWKKYHMLRMNIKWERQGVHMMLHVKHDMTNAIKNVICNSMKWQPQVDLMKLGSHVKDTQQNESQQINNSMNWQIKYWKAYISNMAYGIFIARLHA